MRTAHPTRARGPLVPALTGLVFWGLGCVLATTQRAGRLRAGPVVQQIGLGAPGGDVGEPR